MRLNELNTVDTAINKLCQAHASARISQTLYREQRASVLAYLVHQQGHFPELVFNEYSQRADTDFSAEATPVMADLGFATDMDSVAPPVAKSTAALVEAALAAGPQPTMVSAAELTQDSLEEWIEQSWFDRYYWYLLTVFLGAIGLIFYLFY